MSEAERKIVAIIRAILLTNPQATGKLTVNIHLGSVGDRYAFEQVRKVEAA